jgi:hypothetical protein
MKTLFRNFKLFSRGEVQEIGERRDARRRQWYKEAKCTKANVWTDVAVYRKTALSLYQRLSESFPNDSVAPLFCKRCEAYLKVPPGPDWTGVTHMTRK